jgi:uncharacterized protein (DUF488 family)
VQLLTIGHYNRSIEQFIELLTDSQINLLADVRRFPGSRRQPHFNSENLPKSLANVGIGYSHFPELGGRRKASPDSPNTVWRNEAFRGYADFMMTPEFRTGVDRLLEIAQEKRTAIMCAEALWWQCHRSLIADYLKAAGHTVIHIMGSGKVQEHPFTSAARIVDGKLTYGAGNEPQFLF